MDEEKNKFIGQIVQLLQDPSEGVGHLAAATFIRVYKTNRNCLFEMLLDLMEKIKDNAEPLTRVINCLAEILDGCELIEKTLIDTSKLLLSLVLLHPENTQLISICTKLATTTGNVSPPFLKKFSFRATLNVFHSLFFSQELNRQFRFKKQPSDSSLLPIIQNPTSIVL